MTLKQKVVTNGKYFINVLYSIKIENLCISKAELKPEVNIDFFYLFGWRLISGIEEDH